MRSALRDAFISWIARNQKENADALKEFREKHGVQVLRTPPEILIAYLKAWDDLAKEEAGAQPVLQEGDGLAARLGGDRRCRRSASCCRPTRSPRTTTGPNEKPAAKAAKK